MNLRQLYTGIPLLFLPIFATAKEQVRICYFSTNTYDEFLTTKEFTDKLNAVSPKEIIVEEFMPVANDPKGFNPNVAFEEMVKSGVKCDGLVISGHHTGSWGGDNADGRISMDKMEELSCNPAYADWFRNIQAVWLQGCRTLGSGEIEAVNPAANANPNRVNADFHTNRVGQVVVEDSLEQSFADLGMEFTTTLDQDNPLASRYARLFPDAKQFGWTESAPGKNSKSWLSLLFHMAQTARFLDGEYPKTPPTAAQMDPKSAAQYANALLFTLQNFTAEEQGCEAVALAGWQAHGHVGRPPKYFFDNQDLKSQPSLLSSGDESLLRAKELDCLLKVAIKKNDTAKLNEVLDRIIAEPDFLRYSFSALVDFRSSLAAKKDPKANAILERMRNVPGMKELLISKVKSERVEILRKIEYYKFYTDLTGSRVEELEDNLGLRATEILLNPLPPLNPALEHPDRSRNLAAEYRATLLQSIVKNGIAPPAFYYDLMEGYAEADVLNSMARQVRNFMPNDEEAKRLLLRIAYHRNSNRMVGKTVLDQLSKLESKQAYEQHYQEIWPLLQDRVRTVYEPGEEPGNTDPLFQFPPAPAPVQQQKKRQRNFIEQLFGL